MITGLFKHNLARFLSVKYIAYIVSFFRTVIFASFLGVEGFGYWAFLNVLYSYLMYSSLGIELSLSVNVAKNKENYSIIKFSLFFITVLTTIVLSILYLFPDVYKVDQYSFDPLTITLLACVIYLGLVNKIFNTVSRNYENYNLVVYTELAIVIGTISAAFISPDINSILIGWIASLIIMLFVVATKMSQVFSKILHSKLVPSANNKLVADGLTLFIGGLFYYLIMLSTRTFTGSDFSPSMFGYFSFSISIIYAISMLSGSILWVIYPKLILEYKDALNKPSILQDIKSHQEIYSIISIFILIIGGTFFGLVLEYMNFYVESMQFIFILLIGYYFLSTIYVKETSIVSMDKKKYIILSSGISLLFSISLNLLTYHQLISSSYALNISLSYVMYSVLITISYKVITKHWSLAPNKVYFFITMLIIALYFENSMLFYGINFIVATLLLIDIMAKKVEIIAMIKNRT